MKNAILVAITLILTSTAANAFEMGTIKKAEKTLMGAPEKRLQACIGEPAKSTPSGNQTVVLYSSAQALDAKGLTMSTSGAADAPKACVITFTIEEGVIRKIDSKNRAGWGGGSIKKCSALVKGCIKPGK